MTTLLTPLIIAKEALIVLENNTVMAGLVHRDYSKEFQNVGATVVIRKPTTFTSTAVSDTVNSNTITESSVAVVLDKHLDVTFEVTSKELSLDIVDFSEQLIQPAMRAHAQTVDAYLTGLYADVAGHYAVSGTPAVGDLAELDAVMNVNKVPLQDRRLVLHPMTKAGYMPLEAFLHADKRGDGGQALRKAEMGQVMGFDCYMDQNIRKHTQAESDIVGALKGAWSAGATTGTIDAVQSGGTLLAGDVFKVTGYDEWFVLTANSTASAATAVLAFQPAVTATTLADDAVVTFQATHKANLAFHKNAFALVSAPLAPPIGGAKAAVLNYKGLSCRVVYDYTIMTKKNVISIDMLIGVKTLDRGLAARLCDTR